MAQQTSYRGKEGPLELGSVETNGYMPGAGTGEGRGKAGVLL